MKKIWQKRLIREILIFVIFFLLATYIIFFLINFSINSTRILSKESSLAKMPIFYLSHMIVHLNLFLPFAFMLAIIKVVYRMNIKNELTALQMAGISIKRFSLPIIFLAFIFSTILYLNFEFLSPSSQVKIEEIKTNYIRRSKKKPKKLCSMHLENMKLIYQTYDKKKEEIFDLFLIKSENDIWYIKRLDTSKKVGSYVDHLTRDRNGRIIKSESFDSYLFKELNFDKMKTDPYSSDMMRISTLLSNRKSLSKLIGTKTLGHLHYKLAMPLLPFLIVFAIMPYCTKFSRKNLSFPITAISILLFIAFFTAMDAFLILSENGVRNSIFMIWIPSILIFFLSMVKFLRL